jgi:hypothetical protein
MNTFDTAALEQWLELARKATDTLGLAAFGQAAFAVIGGALALKAAFIAFAVWYAATRPERTARLAETVRDAGMKCLLLGIAGFLAILLVIAVLLNLGPLALVGIILFGYLFWTMLTAFSVAYVNLGLRLTGDLAGERSLVKAAALGGVVCEGLFLVPFFGQVIRVITIFKGLGAMILLCFLRSAPPAGTEETAVSENSAQQNTQ